MSDIYDSYGNVISKTYDMAGNVTTMCYDYQGNQLRKSHAVSNNITKSLFMSLYIPTGTQGFACDNITRTIAQLYTGYIYIIDLDTENYSRTNNINLDHGHTGQFAPTKTDSQDYPFLYVSGPTRTVNDVPYCYMLVISCTSSTAQLEKTIAIPAIVGQTDTMRTCVDFENEIVYLVSTSTYYGTADYMYITAWDMNDTEVLSEGVYALTNKLDEFQIPFVPEVQACTFFDGLIVLLSDKSLAINKYIQFVDVELKDVYLTLNKEMLSGELEGVSFLYNDDTEKYDMLVSQRITSSGDSEYHTEYWRYEFH